MVELRVQPPIDQQTSFVHRPSLSWFARQHRRARPRQKSAQHIGKGQPAGLPHHGVVVFVVTAQDRENPARHLQPPPQFRPRDPFDHRAQRRPRRLRQRHLLPLQRDLGQFRPRREGVAQKILQRLRPPRSRRPFSQRREKIVHPQPLFFAPVQPRKFRAQGPHRRLPARQRREPRTSIRPDPSRITPLLRPGRGEKRFPMLVQKPVQDARQPLFLHSEGSALERLDELPLRRIRFARRGKHPTQYPPPLAPRRGRFQDLEFSVQPQFEREILHHSGKESVERAQIQTRHRHHHGAQQPQKIRRAQSRKLDLRCQPARRRFVRRRAREFL